MLSVWLAFKWQTLIEFMQGHWVAIWAPHKPGHCISWEATKEWKSDGVVIPFTIGKSMESEVMLSLPPDLSLLNWQNNYKQPISF